MDQDARQALRIRTQNPRSYTVQVQKAANAEIVGTGVAVSSAGAIVTCAHVVAAAGVDPRQAQGAEVGVYFPQALGGETKARRAVVKACFPSQYDDDVVLLQLVGGPPPLGPEQIALLGDAAASQGHPFRSYGYSPLAQFPSSWADGRILGCLECPEPPRLQAEPVELDSGNIAPGMSGAGVLDTDRNLVVGLISAVYAPSDPQGRQGQANLAVDARVLSLPPLGLPLHADQPLVAAPAPQTDPAVIRQYLQPPPVDALQPIVFVNAPPPLAEWTGRADLLQALHADWLDPRRHVTGLVGFGGEGKSSLARRWVEEVLQGPQPPEGLFWWGFYENRSVDEFLEALLGFLSGGQLTGVSSAGLRAQLIGELLHGGVLRRPPFRRGRVLIVLDGLEVLQHPEGDQYGLLQSAELRDVLACLARPDNAAFGLVTSRAPLVDLLDYPSYTHRDLARLSPADGRALLRKLGVLGGDADLDALVRAWDGHALTLSLLAALLVERHQGQAAHAADLPAPVAGEPRYERVARILARYDAHLTAPERRFLELFAAFRTPVPETAFEKVFQPLLEQPAAGLQALAQRLAAYRLLRHDAPTHTYTAHPLVRSYYLARLSRGAPGEAQAAHARIKDYYLSIAGETPHYPTLDDLQPLIEVVHHACQAGAYDEAHQIRRERLYQGGRKVLIHQLGAYETNLALMLEFFPGGDPAQAPQVSKPDDQRFILHAVGLCLQSLGRLAEAAPFFERGNAIALELQDWSNAGRGCQNLTELRLALGDLPAAQAAAAQALELARRAENKRDEMASLAWQAWAAHLPGAVPAAADLFAQAEALEREIDSAKRYLYSQRGLRHAAHLRRAGRPADAHQVAEANLPICERNHWPDDASRCHSQLGALDAAEGQAAAAAGHFTEALRLARSISDHATLIEALLARGLWAARHPEQTGLPDPIAQAQAELGEALGYALAGGYRIYEADLRIALAWAALAAGDLPAARREAARARALSQELGYHWGLVDADEVLAAIGAGN